MALPVPSVLKSDGVDGGASSRVLPRTGPGPQKGAVPAPRIPRQGAELGHHVRPDGIQVEVADELQEVTLLLHHDGCVPIVAEMAHTLVAAVERPRIPCEERPHAAGQGALSRPEQQMGVVREQGPPVHGERPVLRQRGEAADEVGAVRIVAKEGVRSIPRTIPWWRVCGASRRVPYSVHSFGERRRARLPDGIGQ